MRSIHRNLLVLSAIFSLLQLAGCSIVAPKYSASMENIQNLKNAGSYAAKVGKFNDQNANQSISLRGSMLVSPYGSYGAYLSEAITQELTLAGKLKPESTIEISGELIKNNLTTSLVSKGYGDIEARFIVSKNGAIRYDQIKVIHYEWESSFVGAIAIPRAQAEYPKLIQQLLSNLYADQAFLDALK